MYKQVSDLKDLIFGKGKTKQKQTKQQKMASYQIPAPSPMSLSGDVVANWKEFEEAWTDYEIATELKGKLKKADGTADSAGEQLVAATLCSILGSEARKVLNSLPAMTIEKRKNPAEILKALKGYFLPKRNVLYERFVFNSATQKTGENIDEFVLRLRQLADSCEFGVLHDELIRDRIVIGTTDTASRERILRMRPVPTLNQVIDDLKAAEATRSQKAAISGAANDVDHIQPRSRPRRSKSKNTIKKRHDRSLSRKKAKPSEKCRYCGKDFDHKRDRCPARNAKCSNCKKMGHFAVVCQSAHADEISDSTDDIFLDFVIDETEDNTGEFWSAQLRLDGKATTFKLDSGSKITVIGDQTPWLDKSKMVKCKNHFRGPGGISLSHKMIGVMPNMTIDCETGQLTEDVYVMANQTKNLLSKRAIHILKLLTPNPLVVQNIMEDTPDFRKEFPKLFQGLGRLKENYTIKTTEDATPICLYTARKVPHPLLPEVEKALNEMERKGVISPVDEPTDWCSGMVVAPKKNGKVRICVDLTVLNKAVRREVHPMASVDDNLAKLRGGKVFTKLDANSGFWQIPLDPASRLLTTFIAPGGRYCFNRLPFGISSAPEIFQRTMSKILRDMDGVICHMDDILIHAPNKKLHDDRVREVLRKLEQAGLTLNEKCEFGKQKITFLGHIVSGDGISADPEKTRSIQAFPAPTNVTELQRFMGMCNQLAKFLPNLSEVNEPIRQLLKKDRLWIWDSPQEKAFKRIKEMLMSTEVLAHYDPRRPTIVAADASNYGVGAVLLQEDETNNRRPICYASRSLTETEKNYAVIEKEALAATWACDKFRDYILGTEFTIETDHRPLVPLLSSTDLSKLPARILRFRLRMMRFAPTVKYVQGKKQTTADALSRAPTQKPTERDLILVEETEQFKDSVVQNIPSTDRTLDGIREAQKSDAICSQIREYITEGWPPVAPNNPLLIQYHNNSHRFTINEDLLMFDTRLVIPQALQLKVLDQIHSGHLGITKCKARALQTVWWPSIMAQVEALCRKCQTCKLHMDEKVEPLLALAPPREIWERVGTDLFEFQKKQYLLLVDYGSRWIDFKELKNTSSKEVIKCLSEIFSTHGTPKIVISDNGPQYASEEFASFAAEWGFNHVTSSPRYPKCNGEAERAVRTAKNILAKNSNPYLGLLAYRSAPIYNGRSPSQLLMSRHLRNTLPMAPTKLQPEIQNREEILKKEEEYKRKYTENHDRRHKVIQLPVLSPGDKVLVRDQGKYGEVVEKTNTPRSYRVTMDHSGNTIRRNRSALVHTGEDSHSPNARKENDSQRDLRRSPPPPFPSFDQNSNEPFEPNSEMTKTESPAKVSTDSNQRSHSGQTRSGRLVKFNMKPDMHYY